MPKLNVNYMRLVAVIMFVLITAAIVISYFFIPKNYTILLADFYHQYWRLLTVLFFIATFFLGFAFYVERGLLAAHWIQHSVAILFISVFIFVGLFLIKIADTFFTFAG